MPLITDRVEQARAGINPRVLCRMKSGWAVIGDVQFLPGYCLLLPDPVVPSLNDLGMEERSLFLGEMSLIGDAVLEVTGAARINYEILGNTEPELHAHIFPRYAHEPEEKRRMPVWFYDWKNAPQFNETGHGSLKTRLIEAIQKRNLQSADEK
ncbi:MAG: HIT domain-containing protein [Chthoniobacteraceae bacterium]